jgi:1-deoxy-D-xylulose-5-phosphate reductoisomerase
MRLPIAAAIAGGDPPDPGVEPLDMATVGRLDFEPVDPERFPAPGLARAALRGGGELPAVLNAANEVAVEAFLGRRCGFDRIISTVEAVLAGWDTGDRALDSVEAVLAVHAEARRRAAAAVGNFDPRAGVSGN